VFILKEVKVVCFDTLLQVFILKDLGDESREAGVRLRIEATGRREIRLANTEKNSIEVHGLSIHLLGIIRMEREGIEKTEGWGG
jgi:hypothetical protein